jgi:hypothetical protein
MGVYEPGHVSLPINKSVGTLILDFLVSRLGEINACYLLVTHSSMFYCKCSNGLRQYVQINKNVFEHL